MFTRLRRGLPVLVPHGGLVTTSYGHIDDLCTGLLALGTHPAAVGEAFNLTGEGVSSAQYVATLAGIVGVEADVVPVPDEALAGLSPLPYGHLFAARHHGVLSTEKALPPAAAAARPGLHDRARADVRVVLRLPAGRRGHRDRRPPVGLRVRRGPRGRGGRTAAGRGVTTDRVDDAALWRSVEATLRDVVVPGLRPGHELDTAVQLQGLAAYAASRPPDRDEARARRLAAVLGAPAGTSLPEALRQASAVLVAAVEAAGDHLADSAERATAERATAERAAPERAAAVRAVLLEQLDEDIAAAAPLLATFSGHAASDEEPAERRVPADELARLRTWFEGALGGPVTVDRAVVISGGHSRRMLRLDVAGPAGPESFVVRIEQGGMFGTDGTLEAGVMRALAQAGLPVAPVRWVEPDAGALGRPFFVMDLVPGGSAVDGPVLESFLRVLDEVHRTDPAVVAGVLGAPPSPQEAVRRQIDRWSATYRESVALPVPLLEEAAAWLRRELRPTGPVVVVHGDPGPGNFLHERGRITALTDWEFVHHGDAAEDWAYFATLRARKLASAEHWYAQIERTVGVRNDRPTWHAWEAFNQFKGACANLTALRVFREGATTTPNLLAIGTAVHVRFLRQLADQVAPA